MEDAKLKLLSQCPHEQFEKVWDIGDLYVGDLLSHVLSHAKPNQIWLTVQNHPTVIAVAVLANLRAVVVVDHVEVPPETIEVASQQGILLFSSSLSAIELIRRIGFTDYPLVSD